MEITFVAACLVVASILVLVAVVQMILVGARLRAMHQEMIDLHETLKRKHQL